MKVNILRLKKHISGTIILVLGLSLSGLSCAAENCVFDNNAVSEKPFSDDKTVAVYQLFPKKNEIKGVFSNGNLFSVKYWSCNHYGKHSFMVIGPEMQTIPDELNSQVMLLGAVSLNEVELKLLVKAIENNPLKLSDLPIKINILTDEFDEFYMQIGIAGEAIFIEIKLYNG